MAATRDYVQRVDRPNFGALYDTFHANIEEQDPIGCIAETADVIKHVHISENDRGTPGKGHIDFAWRRCRHFAPAGYDGWLTIEAFGKSLPALAAATKVWRQFFEKRGRGLHGGPVGLGRLKPFSNDTDRVIGACPAIHVSARNLTSADRWMPGSSPGMTNGAAGSQGRATGGRWNVEKPRLRRTGTRLPGRPRAKREKRPSLPHHVIAGLDPAIHPSAGIPDVGDWLTRWMPGSSPGMTRRRRRAKA